MAATLMVQPLILTLLLASVVTAVVARPAAACTDRMLLASSLFGLPGCMLAVLGMIVATPLSAALGLAGGLAGSSALWALRAPAALAREDPDASQEDDEPGGGGPGPDIGGDHGGGPGRRAIDWGAFEREAHAAFEAHRAGGRGRRLWALGTR